MMQRGWQPCLLKQSKKTKVSLLGVLEFRFLIHMKHTLTIAPVQCWYAKRYSTPVSTFIWASPSSTSVSRDRVGQQRENLQIFGGGQNYHWAFFYLPPPELPQIVRWWFSLSDRQTLATQNSRVVIPRLPLKSSRNHHPLRFMRY